MLTTPIVCATHAIELVCPLCVISDQHREALYLRKLLERVAADLELRAETEDADRAAWLRSRAMRIRQRLHEGPPAEFRLGHGGPTRGVDE